MTTIIKAEADVEDVQKAAAASFKCVAGGESMANGLKIKEEPINKDDFMKEEVFIDLYEQMTSVPSIPNETEPTIEATPAVAANIKQKTTYDDEMKMEEFVKTHKQAPSTSSTTNGLVATNQKYLPVAMNIKRGQVEYADIVNIDCNTQMAPDDASIANEPPLQVVATKANQAPVEDAELAHKQTVGVASTTTTARAPTLLQMAYARIQSNSNESDGGGDANLAKRRRVGRNAQDGLSMTNGQAEVRRPRRRRKIRSTPPLANTKVALKGMSILLSFSRIVTRNFLLTFLFLSFTLSLGKVTNVSGLSLARKYASAPLSINSSAGVECSSGGPSQPSVTLTTQRTSRGISALCVVKRSL